MIYCLYLKDALDLLKILWKQLFELFVNVILMAMVFGLYIPLLCVKKAFTLGCMAYRCLRTGPTPNFCLFCMYYLLKNS